jgi:hypothetical protein
MTYLACPDTPAVSEYVTVHIAWELSKADWKLGVILPGAKTISRYAIGDLRSGSTAAAPGASENRARDEETPCARTKKQEPANHRQSPPLDPKPHTRMRPIDSLAPQE